MELIRKPFQGVINIIRFNWHFYAIAATCVAVLFSSKSFIDQSLLIYIDIVSILIIAGTVVSLLVSCYVYDLSNLYSFDWLDKIAINKNETIVNIHAGFDESSLLLQEKYPGTKLIVLDFYDPVKHTEVSIRRARKSVEPFQGTISISTESLPLANNSADKIFAILAAHEIRNDLERERFFTELNRILKPGGNIIITEHLRDISNFIAYNIGFFHFLSIFTWKKTFAAAHLSIKDSFNITPFIKTFILEKNDPAS